MAHHGVAAQRTFVKKEGLIGHLRIKYRSSLHTVNELVGEKNVIIHLHFVPFMCSLVPPSRTRTMLLRNRAVFARGLRVCSTRLMKGPAVVAARPISGNRAAVRIMPACCCVLDLALVGTLFYC